MVFLKLHFFDKSLWRETEISRGIPITFALAMFSPITLAFFGICIIRFYSIETQKKCIAFCCRTAGVALWGLPVGIFYHLIKLKVQVFLCMCLYPLIIWTWGVLWLVFPFLSIACGCCKTPPAPEWKVHSVAYSQAVKNKAVKCRSETEDLKLQQIHAVANLLSEFPCKDGCFLKLSKYTLNVALNGFEY